METNCRLSTVDMFHESKLCVKSRMSEQCFVSVSYACSVGFGNILMWICIVYCTI